MNETERDKQLLKWLSDGDVVDRPNPKPKTPTRIGPPPVPIRPKPCTPGPVYKIPKQPEELRLTVAEVARDMATIAVRALNRLVSLNGQPYDKNVLREGIVTLMRLFPDSRHKPTNEFKMKTVKTPTGEHSIMVQKFVNQVSGEESWEPVGGDVSHD